MQHNKFQQENNETSLKKTYCKLTLFAQEKVYYKKKTKHEKRKERFS